MALPACVAWMVQVPAERSVTVAVETLQTAAVVELKATGRAEEAVAESAKGALPNGRFDRGAKEIDWLACVIWKVCLTGVAGA